MSLKLSLISHRLDTTKIRVQCFLPINPSLAYRYIADDYWSGRTPATWYQDSNIRLWSEFLGKNCYRMAELISTFSFVVMFHIFFRGNVSLMWYWDNMALTVYSPISCSGRSWFYFPDQNVLVQMIRITIRWNTTSYGTAIMITRLESHWTCMEQAGAAFTFTSWPSFEFFWEKNYLLREWKQMT